MRLSLQDEIQQLKHLNKALNAERMNFFTENYNLETENDALRAELDDALNNLALANAENNNLKAWQAAHIAEVS